MLNPCWTVAEFSRKLFQHFQHLRQTLTTLTTHSWLTLTPLYPTHFPSWGNVSHTCAKVQHGWGLLSKLRLQFLEFLELTTKQLNNHWLRSFECLPWWLWRDSKNTWKLATTNTSKQQLSMLSHKFDIFSLFFYRFRNIECFLWSFHLTEENIFNAKNSKRRHQKQTETAESAEQSQAPPNFFKAHFSMLLQK